MSGDTAYRAVLADCERALGRPENALRLVQEAVQESPDRDELVELRLVEAGARSDLGETAAAALVLEAALGGRPTPEGLGRADLGRLRLATAYADLLAARGESDLADQWYAAIAAADPDDLTGVSEHFGGVTFTDDELTDEDEDEGDDDEDDGAAQPGDLATGDAGGSDAADLDDSDDVASDDDVSDDDVDSDDHVESDDDLPGDDVSDDDIEAEVAELLGEIPAPRATEIDHSRLFQEAVESPAPAADRPADADREHETPTD